MKKKTIYRVKFNNKYFWFKTTAGSVKLGLKRQLTTAKAQNTKHEKLTQVKDLILREKINSNNIDDYSLISENNDKYEQAKYIIKDITTINPRQVLGQKITMVKEYAYRLVFMYLDETLDFSILYKSLQCFLDFMKRYSNIDFGFPENISMFYDKEIYNCFIKDRRIEDLFIKILKQNKLNKFRSENLPDIVLNNYNEAYKKLSNNYLQVLDKTWYMDERNDVKGLIWHFTDINNMANILSYLRIESKNYSKQDKLAINDNASSKVNETLTKSWVHDYARFYFRPKIPTQYRNEGIFGRNGHLNRRLENNVGEIWEKKPAHLPIPIFITFSFKKQLFLGGHVTKKSLAGKSVSDNPLDEFDDNLTLFKEKICQIYDKYSPNNIKQTEFVVKNYMSFIPDDIVNIFVRTEIEKLALLTMLAEHNAKYFDKKDQHKKIDIKNYVDKIIVNPTIFFNDAGKLESIDKTPNIMEMYPKSISSEILKEDIKVINKPFMYIKRYKDKIFRVYNSELRRIIFKVIDINGEQKTVGVFHQPDWILATAKWTNKKYKKISKYYSKLYYNHEYFDVYRNVNEEKWYLTSNNMPLNLKPEEKEILKKVEENATIELKKEDEKQ